MRLSSYRCCARSTRACASLGPASAAASACTCAMRAARSWLRAGGAPVAQAWRDVGHSGSTGLHWLICRPQDPDSKTLLPEFAHLPVVQELPLLRCLVDAFLPSAWLYREVVRALQLGDGRPWACLPASVRIAAPVPPASTVCQGRAALWTPQGVGRMSIMSRRQHRGPSLSHALFPSPPACSHLQRCYPIRHLSRPWPCPAPHFCTLARPGLTLVRKAPCDLTPLLLL